MQGSLSSAILPKLLGELYLGHKTGLLQLARGDGCLSVRLREGRLVGLDGDLEDLLSRGEGSFSFEEKEVTEEDPAPGISMEALIHEAARRLQDPDLVRAALGDIDQCLALTEASARTGDGLTPTDGYILSRVDGRLSAREVIQLTPLDPDETCRALLGLLLTGLLQYRPPAAKPASGRPVGAPAREGPEPPLQIDLEWGPVPTSAEPPSTEEGRTQLEAKRREILKAFAGLPTRTHFEVLEVPEDADELQIKEAYFRLAKRFHPDVHLQPALHDIQDMLEAVFVRLGEAYEVLGHAPSRAAYRDSLPRPAAASPPRTSPPPPSAPLPPPPAAVAGPPEPAPLDEDESFRIAEETIRRAEGLLAEREYWDVIQLLQGALPRIQGRKQRQRARVILARAYLKNPKWVRRGEELLQTVLGEDPRNIDATFILATIYKEKGLQSRALAMFRKVLELKPDHREAAAELSARLPLIKRLFGGG